MVVLQENNRGSTVETFRQMIEQSGNLEIVFSDGDLPTLTKQSEFYYIGIMRRGDDRRSGLHHMSSARLICSEMTGYGGDRKEWRVRMAMAGNTQGASISSRVFSAWHPTPTRGSSNLDLLTVLIAILLPWSTTGVVIAAALWVVALIPTLELGAFWRSVEAPHSLAGRDVRPGAGWTPWSDAPWGERLYAVGPTAKLLLLPLLLYHCERSSRGVGSSSPFWRRACS